MRRLFVTGTLIVGAVSALSLATPESATAITIPIGPGPAIGELLGLGSDVVTGSVRKAAVEAFGAIIKLLFSWPAKLINRELLAWLVAVPDYAIDPGTARTGRQGSNLAELGATTTVMAFAALGAVGTVAAIRYWAAGLTGSGGFDALEGLARTVGAALLIVLWPWLFRHSAELSNEAGRALLGSGSVLDDTARLLGVAFAAAVASNILAILIAILAAVLFLALLVCKIAVSAATALVFVGMPLALMLWPIPELAWIARTAMRAFATVLVIPLAWAVSFATFAAVGIDALSLKGASGFVDALVMPLVAITLLWITVILPKTLARLAMFGALGGGGFVGRTVSHLVARRVDAALVQHLPANMAGQRTSTPQVRSGEPSTSRTRRSQTETAATNAETSASQPAAGATPVGTTVAASSEGSHSTVVPASGAVAHGGALRTPAWSEIEHRVPVEQAIAADRESSTTRADVAGAMQTLRPDERQGVIELLERKGDRVRGEMAHQAASGNLSDVEREAFRTLAAATPAVRAQGIEDFLGRPPADQPTTRQSSNESIAPPGSDRPMGTDTAAPPDRERQAERRSK